MQNKRTARQVVKRALAEVGYTEKPMGSNHTKYGKAFGLDPAYWCAMFVWWVINYGEDAIIPKTAYTPHLQAWAKAKGILRTKDYLARVGDIVLFQMPGPDRVNHVGIVVRNRKAGEPLYCVEGNTGGSNPRAGGMVAPTKRVSNIRYIIDMREEYRPEPKPVVKPVKKLTKPTVRKTQYTLTKVLMSGSAGAPVKMLQTRLGLHADGIYGSKTVRAVKAYQKKHGLTVDGTVGRVTASHLGWRFK